MDQLARLGKGVDFARFAAVAECGEEQAVVCISEYTVQQQALYEAFKRIIPETPYLLVERGIEPRRDYFVTVDVFAQLGFTPEQLTGLFPTLRDSDLENKGTRVSGSPKQFFHCFGLLLHSKHLPVHACIKAVRQSARFEKFCLEMHE